MTYDVVTIEGAVFDPSDGGFWSNHGTRSAPMFTVEAAYPAAVRAQEAAILERLRGMGIAVLPGYSKVPGTVFARETTDGRIVAVVVGAVRS